MTARHTLIDSDLGELTLTANDDALTGLYFTHHWYPPTPARLGGYVAPDDDLLFRRTRSQLADYLAGERRCFDLPHRLDGNDFQRSVWALLVDIPYGGTTTYGALAFELGDRSWAQWVGQAVGDNPLSVIIPCHRVVGADRKLTGYAGGLERKRMLLDLEESRDTKAARLF